MPGRPGLTKAVELKSAGSVLGARGQNTAEPGPHQMLCTDPQNQDFPLIEKKTLTGRQHKNVMPRVPWLSGWRAQTCLARLG
jgi:hypothetical protein